jgi:hypothetical protein
MLDTPTREPQSIAVLTLLVLVGVFLSVAGWLRWVM